MKEDYLEDDLEEIKYIFGNYFGDVEIKINIDNFDIINNNHKFQVNDIYFNYGRTSFDIQMIITDNYVCIINNRGSIFKTKININYNGKDHDAMFSERFNNILIVGYENINKRIIINVIDLRIEKTLMYLDGIFDIDIDIDNINYSIAYDMEDNLIESFSGYRIIDFENY